MKNIHTNYIFNPGAKTIQIVGAQGLALSDILIINNATRNKLLYNFAAPALGGTFNSATGILTITADTTGMLGTDSLQIFLNSNDSDEMYLLRRLVTLSESLGVVDAQRRQRITLGGSDITLNVACSGTVNVTTLTNFNNSTDLNFLREAYRTNYNTAIRAKLLDI